MLSPITRLAYWIAINGDANKPGNAGLIGRGDRIRTYDPCLPKAVLYQAELHPDDKNFTLIQNLR
jgi:hypothetical protein